MQATRDAAQQHQQQQQQSRDQKDRAWEEGNASFNQRMSDMNADIARQNQLNAQNLQNGGSNLHPRRTTNDNYTPSYVPSHGIPSHGVPIYPTPTVSDEGSGGIDTTNGTGPGSYPALPPSPAIQVPDVPARTIDDDMRDINGKATDDLRKRLGTVSLSDSGGGSGFSGSGSVSWGFRPYRSADGYLLDGNGEKIGADGFLVDDVGSDRELQARQEMLAAGAERDAMLRSKEYADNELYRMRQKAVAAWEDAYKGGGMNWKDHPSKARTADGLTTYGSKDADAVLSYLNQRKAMIDKSNAEARRSGMTQRVRNDVGEYAAALGNSYAVQKAWLESRGEEGRAAVERVKRSDEYKDLVHSLRSTKNELRDENALRQIKDGK